jgi:hypothetical protein
MAAILTMWCAAIVIKAIAAYLLVRNGLVRRFPALWAYISFCAVSSAVLLYLHSQPQLYVYAFSVVNYVQLVLESLAIIGVFWAVTERYPNFGRPGTILLSTLGMIGITAAWSGRSIAVPELWEQSWRLALLLERHLSLVMITVLAGTRAALALTRVIPVRPSARRAADILTLHAIMGLAAASYAIGTSMRYPALASILPLADHILMGILIATRLTKASDELPEPEPISEQQLERFKAEQQARAARIGELIEAARNTLAK